jgi:hypothetical protein
MIEIDIQFLKALAEVMLGLAALVTALKSRPRPPEG